jgi:DinB superfamily
MKKILFPVVLLLVLGFTTKNTGITKAERKLALAKLKDTKKHFKNVTKGLSATQLNFKANDSSWSVAECAEHIALTETALYGMLEGALKANPDPAKRGDVKFTDDQIWNMITDRTNKVKTPEIFKPSGKFGSFEGIVKEFNDKRDLHIQNVKKMREDLRNRYAQLPQPFGTIDAYQVIIFLAAHSERHIKQMEEVKTNPNFPKS